MPAAAVLISLFLSVPPQQAPAQAVSLVDILVEGQTLYTLAVDTRPENLTAALDLARQAQRAVADETVRKRLSASARPDPQDLTVLGSLRARISILVGDIEKRRTFFIGEFEDIQKLLQRKRLDEARLALDSLPLDAPAADPACPFADLRAQLDAATTLAREKSSGGTNRKAVAHGIVWTAVFAGTAFAAHMSMNNTLNEMNYLFPGTSEWRSANNSAEQMRMMRNGFAVAAFGVGTAFAIYGAVKAERNNKSPSRAIAPFGKDTFVGVNPDPRRPAILVVRIF